jgi:hypothetical protein
MYLDELFLLPRREFGGWFYGKGRRPQRMDI